MVDYCVRCVSTEIVDGIHRVDGVNANVYLVFDGLELTVIDTGMPRNAKKILEYVDKINRPSSSISHVVLTHCHLDHVGSAFELRKLTNAKIGVHKDDADFVAGKKSLAPKGIVGIPFRFASVFFRFTPFEPDVKLKDNDRVGGLVVIHTPGHTPGSISLFDPVRKVLFVGDAITYVDGELSGPTERFTVDMRQAMQSIEKISQLDFDAMLSGHGDPLKTSASDKIKEFSGTLKRAVL